MIADLVAAFAVTTIALLVRGRVFYIVAGEFWLTILFVYAIWPMTEPTGNSFHLWLAIKDLMLLVILFSVSAGFGLLKTGYALAALSRAIGFWNEHHYGMLSNAGKREYWSTYDFIYNNFAAAVLVIVSIQIAGLLFYDDSGSRRRIWRIIDNLRRFVRVRVHYSGLLTPITARVKNPWQNRH